MKNRDCIDAGREGCPCALAEGGKCLICGKLSGGSCQDCSWQGTCIYTLYAQNNRRLIKARKERLLRIVEIREYSERLKVLVVAADKGFCQKAQTVGTYLFLRNIDKDIFYDLPISILKVDTEENRIHLAVFDCGPKSHSLLEAEDHVVVRGVYYNGLSGMNTLDKDGEETVVYAKGVAIAPLRNLLDGGARYSKWMKNLHLYIDLDKIGLDFLKDYFGDLPTAALQVMEFSKENLPAEGDLEHYEAKRNIMALTSPYYADYLERELGKPIVRPTQGNMCCGEGTCGACTFDNEVGKTVHRCKART